MSVFFDVYVEEGELCILLICHCVVPHSVSLFHKVVDSVVMRVVLEKACSCPYIFIDH